MCWKSVEYPSSPLCNTEISLFQRQFCYFQVSSVCVEFSPPSEEMPLAYSELIHYNLVLGNPKHAQYKSTWFVDGHAFNTKTLLALISIEGGKQMQISVKQLV